MITKHQVEQGSLEWHELRADKYTGSNAHRLLRGYRTPPEDNGFAGNFWTKRGHILESEAIELYETIKHCEVERPGFVTNSRYPACGYSPDGLTEELVIEVKCFAEPQHRKLLAGEIPMHVLAQIHFGMLICAKRAAQLVIYNPELEAKEAFKVIDIAFNRNINRNFIKILAGVTS